MKALKSWRKQRAKEMGIDPSLVCSNAQIELLSLASPKNLKDLEGIATLRAWQRRLYGTEICGLLK
jgi:ribonuclease D